MRERGRVTIMFIVLSVLLLALFILDISFGSVDIPVSDVWKALTGGDVNERTLRIVRDIRLVKATVAVLAGAALGVSGLEMQTYFRNPLAGPYVLGVSSGASLGVALLMLAGGALGLNGGLGTAAAAWIGSAAVLAVVAIASRRVRDIMVILILGMMFSSGVSAVVQILQYLSREDALKSYVIWTMGSLGDVTGEQLAILVPSIIIGLALSIAAIKPLNLLLLGSDYARTMGLNPTRTRSMVFISTTLLAGTVTAFCGPIGFIGLAVPHVTRMFMDDSDHRILVPATIIMGAAVLVGCDIVSKLFALPVNAITALLGVPIVAWIVLRNRI